MTDPVFALEPDVPRNVRLARWLLFRLLSGLREGSLTVREGAQTFHFGDPAAALRAEARVCTPEVYWRLLTGGSLAAAEAWMDGEWETHNLTVLLELFAANSQLLERLERGFRLLGRPVERLRHWTRRNSLASRRVKILPRITTWAIPFIHIFWIRSCFTPARCLLRMSRISRRRSRPKWRVCANSWRCVSPITCWKSVPAGGRWRNTRHVTTAVG